VLSGDGEVLVCLLPAAAAAAALGEDTALLGENAADFGSLPGKEPGVLGEFSEDPDTEAIKAPQGTGELIGMAAALGDEGPPDEMNLTGAGDPEPEVIVLAGRERFVEATDLIEHLAADHDRRGADEALPEESAEGLPLGFGVALPRVHPDPLPDPDLLGVTECGSGKGPEVAGLAGELFGVPEVIGVEKSYQRGPGGPQTPVPGRTHPAVLLAQEKETAAVRSQKVSRSVRRTVINDDQFEIAVALTQDRIDGLQDHRRPIEGRDNY
jgi:hypothetical protein